MEQKRTLWIVAAAGIFLLVVVGAALILYSPTLQKSSVHQASFDSNIGWVGTIKESEDEITSESALAKNDEFNSNSLFETSDTSSDVAVKTDETVTLNPFENAIKADNVMLVSETANVIVTDKVNLEDLRSKNVSASNEKTEAQMSKASEIAAEKKLAEAPVKTTAPKSTAPAKTSSVAAAPKTSAPKTTTVAKATTSAKTTSSVHDTFWVQAAAYSSKRNADEARSVLESNKIPTEVFTVDSNGKTMYRVRVGPYTTKTEAEYWQKEIAKIDKFSSTKSQIFTTKIN